MVYIDILMDYPDYKELLKEIEKTKTTDKNSKNLLQNVVTTLKDFSKQLKQIETKVSSEQNESKVWKNYQQLQSIRLSLLNMKYRWKNLWVPNLSKEFHYLIPTIEDAMEELFNYAIVFEDAIRAHIDVLEIQNSRENRRHMRKIGFLALLVSTVFPT